MVRMMGSITTAAWNRAERESFIAPGQPASQLLDVILNSACAQSHIAQCRLMTHDCRALAGLEHVQANSRVYMPSILTLPVYSFPTLEYQPVR